ILALGTRLGFNSTFYSYDNINRDAAIIQIEIEPTAIGRFAQELPSGMFYFDANREIFCAALLLHSQGKPTDLTFMTALLAATDRLEQVGGSGRLVDIVAPGLDDDKG
ncbi:MAG: hypothetical protein EBZ22_05235, partial [Flavobacteriia bacterium]|nr:hypothetical protein [Flavobacteriia bacterium]